MSVQAILSVAARKAAADVKQSGAQAMIFVLFLAVAVGGFLNFNRPSASTKPVAEAPSSNSSSNTNSGAATEQPAEPAAPAASGNSSAAYVATSAANIPAANGSVTDGTADLEDNGRVATITQGDLATLTSASTDAFFTRASSQTNLPGVQSLYLHADNDISATLDFKAADPASISNVKVTLIVGGEQYLVFLPNGTLDRTFINGNATYTYVGAIKQLIDGQNRVISGSLLNSQFVHITITVQNVSDKVIATAISVGAEY